MRRMKAKDGQRLFRKVKAKIFFPGNQKHLPLEHRAPNGQGITEDGIAKWLENVSSAIEKKFPGHEYRMVELSACSFNFIWVGEIDQPAEAETPVEPEAVSA